MSILGAYDPELEMFIEPEHPLDIAMLEFLRWLVQTGRLVGDTAPRRKDDD